MERKSTQRLIFQKATGKTTRKNHGRSNEDNYRDSRSNKSIKSDTGRLKRKTKKTFTTTQSKIDELGNDDFDLTSSDIRDISGNSYLQFHNKMT